MHSSSVEKESYLGLEIHHQIENERMKKMFEDRKFPEEYTKRLV